MRDGRLIGRKVCGALAAVALLFLLCRPALAQSDSKLCLGRKIITMADDRLEEACARYIKSGDARGKNLAAAYAARALSLANRGEYDRALQEQDQALRLWPDSANLRRNRGTIYVQKGDYDRSIDDLNEAAALNRKDPITYYWLGYAYYFKQDYERALDNFTMAIRYDADYASAYVSRGLTYSKMQNYDRAIAEYTRAIKSQPKDAQAYLRRCEAYFDKRDFDRALPDCNEALQRDPKLGAQGRRCEIYVEKGEFDRALRDCEEDIRRDGQSISSHLWRGYIREQKGDLDLAAYDYQKALEVDLTFRTVHVPRALGATLDDVRNHLAKMKSAGGGQQSISSAASSIASLPAQGDARPILEKRGLLGVWSFNCAAAVSQQNRYYVFRALDDKRVQRDEMIGPAQRDTAGVIETAAEAGNELTYTLASETRTVRLDGNRSRVIEIIRDGTKTIANGSYLMAYGNAALTGKETPWASKCQ
jgi:tetratricopeptide (TPR) repeat protein